MIRVFALKSIACPEETKEISGNSNIRPLKMIFHLCERLTSVDRSGSNGMCPRCGATELRVVRLLRNRSSFISRDNHMRSFYLPLQSSLPCRSPAAVLPNLPSPRRTRTFGRPFSLSDGSGNDQQIGYSPLEV